MRRVTVRKSSVHGRGVFALQAIPAGRRILEYRGEVTSWRRASARYRRSGVPGHTFIFGSDKDNYSLATQVAYARQLDRAMFSVGESP